jgi:hypothetical protein
VASSPLGSEDGIDGAVGATCHDWWGMQPLCLAGPFCRPQVFAQTVKPDTETLVRRKLRCLAPFGYDPAADRARLWNGSRTQVHRLRDGFGANGGRYWPDTGMEQR